MLRAKSHPSEVASLRKSSEATLPASDCAAPFPVLPELLSASYLSRRGRNSLCYNSGLLERRQAQKADPTAPNIGTERGL